MTLISIWFYNHGDDLLLREWKADMMLTYLWDNIEAKIMMLTYFYELIFGTCYDTYMFRMWKK